MVATTPRTLGLAVTSLVLGILSLVFLITCVLGPPLAIPAVICGHIAKSRIKAAGGALGGDGMALAGLITGYICLGLTIFVMPLMLAIAIPSFVKARETAQHNTCINNLRQIDGAKESTTLEQNLDVGAAIPTEMLDPYLRGGWSGLICPKGGTYTANPVGTDPECSVHGSLSDPR